jgi:flagellar motor switch protein FliG
MPIKTDYRCLTGPQKAAIFLMALGEDHGSQILHRLDDDEIKEVSQIMANLGTVTPELIETLYAEFADNLLTTGTLVGSIESTERLLTKALPSDQASRIMEEIRGPAGRTMWDKLGNVNEAVLANYLKNEYPQTVAVVLAKIKPDHAARVLALLPENFAMEVVMRMLRMEAVQKEVLDQVEDILRTEFMGNLARTQRRDTHELMADIFNNLDRTTENRLMSSLEERNRESAEKIKALMFTFEDLVRLDAAGIQTLLRQVEKDRLSLALKGASDGIKDLFMKNMSERAAKMLKEDMDAMGPVRLRDVDQAQSLIVVIAKELAVSGQIIIYEGHEQDELVY